MKKIILFFATISLAVSLAGQSGDGLTPGTAYYGTISTTQSWPVSYNGGIIYVGQNQAGRYDLTIGNGGSLTIDPGVKVIFCTNSTDLIVTGTGSLTADGTPSSKITFTRNYPTINYWGHISFESMGAAGASVFDNCIIEYGDVTSFSNADPHGGGGGIFIDFNDVSLTNCILQHNKSQWGGGVFVFVSRYPSIKNCTFYDNSAIEAGGGIFLYNYASSVIENSIFYSNSCQGVSSNEYSGGGVAALSLCYIQLVNCTFANNTSSRTNGQGLTLSNSSSSKIVNSVFWGSNSEVYLSSGTNGNTIINCAIQSGVPSGSVNCIALNSSNTASDGPNFTDPSTNDYSIKFVSPCRDAGVNSYTGVTIPSTDFLGKSTIGTKDIGAYEVQYSRWLTNALAPTSWGTPGNWEQGLYPGLSGTTGDVVIPALANDTNAPNISGTTDIASGKYLILEAGAKATLATISNSGTLKLMADDPFSLIVNSYSNNSGAGTEQIELYLSGEEQHPGINNWHYISSPVSSLAVSTFSPTHTKNLAQFVESLPSGNAYEGWIAYDGYNYATGTIPSNPPYTFSSLNVGQGYNYFHTVNLKYTFSGDLNTTDVPKTLAYTGAPNSSIRGFNLLGNPFSSGLDWDIIANGTYPSNTSKAIHFTQNNIQCDYINGIGTNGATGIIPPMQGFFVKANNTPDIALTIPAAARVHNAIHARYKGATGTIPLVRLSLSENGISDETVVRFDELAKAGYDYDFDAVKMFLSTEKTSIYSSVSGTNYAINGQPFPDTFVEIPVVVNLTTSGNHNISAIQLQGLDDYNVTLTDKTTGFSADLKTTPNLTFSASAGLITDRFILKVSNAITGIENPAVSKNIFNIYSSNDLINIQTIADEWDGQQGSVTVLDLSGKKVSDLSNTEFNKNSITQVAAPSSKGMYFVELRSGLKRYVGKVVIR